MSIQIATIVEEGRPFLVGGWLVEPRLNRLTRGDVSVQLELKAMDVLLCLVECAGEVVSKHDLLDAVWQTEFVSDSTITGRIAELRNGFGDDAQNPRYIETIRKRGYRLIAEVDAVSASTEPASCFPETPSALEDEPNPYPGLAAFTEADADRFFGREAETAALWRKISSRRLLAVIGPSGIGKSSLLRAGLAPRAPPGWRVVVFTPGAAPALSLARALAPDHTGDSAAVARLVGFTDPDTALAAVSRWRGRFHEALLIVDQFEELFTLNPPGVQTGFIDLLRRLVDAADIHLVLAMRDDFLYQCQRYPQIGPVFKDLTPLGPPTGEALRRALKEPAARLLYRFESERLVDRIVGEVEDERGALPLLAFAVRRLWEERDREQRALTEAAYDRIGGVAGALAKHAEATLDRLGSERMPIVRELFRNLVTAEGTRTVREWDDLLSVFNATSGLGSPGDIPPGYGERNGRRSPGDKPPGYGTGDVGPGFIPGQSEAEEVLGTLIDARLLTSYEVHEEDREPARRVEIVHESMLTNWPRLVRWQTQDADAAQLRGQLRQAARTWEEHGRSDDLLWTGSAYLEYALWRERYPGGLTETETAFGDAMKHHAGKLRRRRRIAVATVFAVLLAVMAIIGISRLQAIAEAERAEAAQLVALGEVELKSFPTSALAWATASLGIADTPEGRMLALRALQEGPPVTTCLIDSDGGYGIGLGGLAFSPNGRWIVDGGRRVNLRFHDGGEPIAVEQPESDDWILMGFASDELLITGDQEVHRWWSIPEVERPTRVEEHRGWLAKVLSESYLSYSFGDDQVLVNRWPLGGGPGMSIGGMETWIMTVAAIDAMGSQLAYTRGNTVFVRSLDEWSRAPRTIGEHDHDVSHLAFHPEGERVAAADRSGEIRVWSISSTPSEPVRTLDLGGMPTGILTYDRSGGRLAGFGDNIGLRVFDLTAPAGVAALTMRRSDEGVVNAVEFHPGGSWLVTGNHMSLSFWPLSHRYPWVLDHGGGRVANVAFTPNGRWLVTVTSWEHGTQASGKVRAWPLEGQNGGRPRVLLEKPPSAFDWAGLDIDPSGELVAVSASDGTVYVLPLEGGQPQEFVGHGSTVRNHIVVFSPDGLRLAVVPRFGPQDVMVVRILDLESGENREVSAVRGSSVHLDFIDDRRLRWAGNSLEADGGGEMIFDLRTGGVEILSEGGTELSRAVSSTGDFVVTTELVGGSRARPESEISWSNLQTGETGRIRTHGGSPDTIALDPTDRWMVSAGGYDNSVVRVGSVSGEEPHLLFGHDNRVLAVKFSPDGRRIASACYDGTVRVWPVPDMSKPPLHVLPHDELIAKLKSLTNFRVVRDEESSTGWKLEVGPFSGWKTVPEW